MTELKELCELLFPNTDNTEFNDISAYIQKLGSQKWEDIQKEPEKLQDQMKQVTKETQELAFTNYKTFVETAEVSKTIMKDLGRSKESLSKFMETMPHFMQDLDNFSHLTSNVLQEKSRFRNMKSQSDKLLELLELPSLMREALNAEDYESALDIFTFIRNISKRYAAIPIVQSTTSEIMTLWFETLYHLFNQLRYDLPLPQCLQILGYLRRANTVYKTTEDSNDIVQYSSSHKVTNTGDGLHLHFLKARNAWFENALEEAKNADSSERFLRRLVELHRIHLFNVLTQHKSIFLSDSHDSAGKDDELNGICALSCWLKLKIEILAMMLNQGLLKEDDSTFESLYNQCMYLCLSFGRVGADMRNVLVPLFRNNILTFFRTNIDKANSQFEAQMRTYKVSSIKNVSRPSNPGLSVGPPDSLLDYYPLAEYCNNLLIILNSLRVTAPLNIVKIVYDSMKQSFSNGVEILLNFYQREQQAFADIEKVNFVLFCVCFSEDFMPFIVKCLAQSFSATLVAEQLGVTLTVLQDSKILYINHVQICEPLNAITGISLT